MNPFFILLFILCFTFFEHSASAAIVEGVVVTQSGIIQNPVVHAYKNLSEAGTSKPFKTSVKGDKSGHFSLELPDGRFWLTAEGSKDGIRYYSFHGGNPLEIKGRLWIPFAAVPAKDAVEIKSVQAAVSGTVTYKGKPVSGASVSLYKSDSELIRGVGLHTITTDSNGRFSISTNPSLYRVIARKKFSDPGSMRLSKGDLFCSPSSNPVEVRENTETQIELPCYPKDDIVSFQSEGLPVKRDKIEFTRLREARTASSHNIFSGTVSDINGNPLKSLKIQAFRKDPLKPFSMNMLRLKSDLSTVSGSKGEFSLPLMPGEEYLLIAREFEGRSPEKGEIFGIYEGNTDHFVTSETGNIRITAAPVMNASAKTSFESKSEAVNIQSDKTFKNRVIERDETWMGEIIVEGKIVVAKSSTLKILPGSRVKFRKIDLDNDGIGDGEIRVLGRLIAAGTPENPVIFSSAENNAGDSDWSYILFFTSPYKNTVNNCIIRNAFSGVQSHFSTVTVSDSIFEENNEGMRYGRSDLTVKDTVFAKNRTGIRFHRLEGEIRIENNLITDNGNGIFFIPSGQNRVDFLTDSYTVDASRLIYPVIKNNAIYGNRDYNFKMGFRQRHDLDLSGNWWGSDSKKEISESILDNRFDNELGRVQFEPYLDKAPAAAGLR